MADDADLAAIRAFLASGGQLETDKNGNVVAPIETQPAAATAGDSEPDADEDETPAPQTPQNQRPPRQPKPQKGKALGRLGNVAGGLSRWAENIPTPGGNLALVLILLFFAFAIIPVNAGKTRLQLIWLVLTGNADLANGSGQDSASSAAANAGTNAGNVAAGAAVGGALPGITGTSPGSIAIGGAIGGLLPSLGLGSLTTSQTAQPTGAGPVHLNDSLALLESPRGGDW